MAPFRQARLMSVVLLFATLSAGVLIGVAWSERGGDMDAIPLEGVEPTRQTAADGDASAEPADSGAARPDGNRGRRRPVIYELDLDSVQLARLDGLRRSFSQEFERLDDERDRRARELRRAVWDSTRAVLRPGQLAMYDSLLTARSNRNDTIGGDGRDDDSDRRRRPEGQDGNHRPYTPKPWKDQ